MLRERISLIAESGQTMAEYAVVLMVIVLGVIVSLTIFSDAVVAGLTEVGDAIRSLA